MNDRSMAECAFEQGQGILRLVPNWVPRAFCVPGRRIKLHPNDYYALGGQRGGIDERWFSSTTRAENGPGTPEDEGLSYIVYQDGGQEKRLTLFDAVAGLGAQLIGERLWQAHHGWPMFSKFFDNKGALPHHIHHREEHARLVGQRGKPEAYYFSPQMNNYGADYPYTFFGLRPGTTKGQLKASLQAFSKGDNHITDLSAAYRLTPGTGWDVPAGVLHAPGSLCTYEPQVASDVFAMYQSLVGDAILPKDLLWKNCPPDRLGDYDYLVEIVDWEANVDPLFAEHHFMQPKAAHLVGEMAAEGYQENWVCYKSPAFSAKELTVNPGRTVTIRDSAAYGVILVQGHGKMGAWEIETPSLIRFGQLTRDEFFVSEEVARAGVVIHNPSDCDPIVMLKHFGPENPDMIL